MQGQERKNIAMTDVNNGVTPEEVLEAPPVEEVEATTEVVVEPEKTKEEVVEKPPVPYDRFKEINEELKATRQEIQELKSKGKEEGLSEDEKKELAAKTYIEKIASEALDKRVAENATAEAERERGIAEEIKFYNSIDKDFTDKIAEDIGNRYGTEKAPLSIEVAYKIFQNEKDLKSKIPSIKPKLPNPIRSSELPEPIDEKEIKTKTWGQLAEDAKNLLKGNK